MEGAVSRYVILVGAWFDRSAGTIHEAGAAVEMTDAQAGAFGLDRLRRVDAPAPLAPDHVGLLARIRVMPATEAVAAFNAAMPSPVRTKTAAIATLGGLINEQASDQ